MAGTWHWRDSFSGPVAYTTPQHPAAFSSLNTGAFGNPFTAQLHQTSFRKAPSQPQTGLFSMTASGSPWGSSSASSSSLAGIAGSNQQTHSSSAKPRTTGRKRSRDEMSAGDFESGSERSPPSSVATSPDAMTDLPMPSSSYTEEVSERLRSSSLLERPSLESRKSMRLLDSAAGGAATAAPGEGNAHEVPIDDATLTLGIGWCAVPSTATMVAASRGWAKHIENHFPLQSVRFVWHNRAGPTYLVSAVTSGVGGSSGMYSPGSPGYYLFNEELTYGQLVAKSWERALDNLRERPMVFDGEPMILPGANLPLQQDRPLIDMMVPSAVTAAAAAAASAGVADNVAPAMDIEMSD